MLIALAFFTRTPQIGDEYGYDYGQPSENITIRDCVISTPCAAVAVGSEMSGGVSNVLVSGMRLWDSTAGVHIKSGPGRGGYVRGTQLLPTLDF